MEAQAILSCFGQRSVDRCGNKILHLVNIQVEVRCPLSIRLHSRHLESGYENSANESPLIFRNLVSISVEGDKDNFLLRYHLSNIYSFWVAEHWVEEVVPI